MSGQMLDLTVYSSETMPVKVSEDIGVLNLRKPTQRTLLAFSAVKAKASKGDDSGIHEVMAAALSNNTEGRKVTVAELDELDMPLDVIMGFMDAYGDFAKKLLDAKNSKSPQKA